jgi:hypothetical protein
VNFNNETKLFNKDIREVYINILTNYRNIQNIENILWDCCQCLGSCITDFYTIMRMFQTFNVKNTTNPCDVITTPENVLVYSGLAHTHIYVDFLNIFFDCALKIDNGWKDIDFMHEINMYNQKNIRENIDYYTDYIKLNSICINDIHKRLSSEYPSIPMDPQLLNVSEIKEKINKLEENLKLLTDISNIKRVPIDYNGQVHIEHQTINKLQINSFDELIHQFTR